jgi:hypothetical protein
MSLKNYRLFGWNLYHLIERAFSRCWLRELGSLRISIAEIHASS